jgi:hypothetical protein
VLAVRIIVAIAGAAVVLATLASALQTVVVPRAKVTRLTWIHFSWIREAFAAIANPRRSFAARDRVLAVYAPLALVTLPFAWLTLVIGGFAALFWGIGVNPLSEAIAVSGSSMTTLGFERPDGLGREILAVVESALGLGLVALLISYLPSIYAAFQRRERVVGGAQTRMGLPPSPVKMYRRYVDIGWLDRVGDDVFPLWESWFVDIEESHTSQPWLVFFRSPFPERSWITAAGTVLDLAALHNSVIDLPHDPRADLFLRAGYLSLRRIADSFMIRYDPDPRPDDPISITRAEFDVVCAQLEEAGAPIIEDLDQGWRDFSGWRVNYDTVLIALATLVVAPPAPWSSDRADPSLLPSLVRRRH